MKINENSVANIRADIEINTHCNASCIFCPQRVSPKKRATMGMDIFTIVVDFLMANNIGFVSLNHYGEPLLDTHFFERVHFLNQSKIQVALFSNLISINSDIVKELSKAGNIYDLFINLSSIHSKEWAHLTGVKSSLHQNVLNNIVSLSKSFKGNITILVGGSDPSQPERLQKIKEYFCSYKNINVKKIITNSRGGILKNKYILETTPKTTEIWCNHRYNVLNISVESEIFLCCQDYYQKNLIGYNIVSYFKQNNSHKNISDIIKMNNQISQPIECVNCAYKENTYAILPE